MKKILNSGLLMMVTLVVTTITIFGQGPLQKRIDFSINTPYAIRMGKYMLPPGNYVLRQATQNDLNLFALYPEDLTNEPIAMIRTARVSFQSSRYPDDTKLFVEMDEWSPDNHPVLQGWTIPGEDGWEVIAVVEKKSGVLTRVNLAQANHSKKYKLDKNKAKFSKYDKNDRRSKIQFKKIDRY
ncbi:MAG: hypothetical protein MOB07_11080 [Acidobacteria bacterium]|nr:hypothetical protein [Acidobacteriota bacterium]